MRDKTAYCARPRELSEPIGVVLIVWENSAQDSDVIGNRPVNSQFNCEVELSAGFLPHAIFGPQHRIDHDASVFRPIPLTEGDKVVRIFCLEE